jgi:hypothetical protein
LLITSYNQELHKNQKEEAVDNFDKLLTRVDPCMLFTRTQENKKTRSVWGYPIVDTLMELRYFIPLLSYSKKARHRSAVNGPEAVDRAMTDLILTAVKKDEHLVSIDFSAYDSSLKLGLQKHAFQYIKDVFQKTPENEKWIDYIAWRFGTIGLITPDGVKDGPHGVPSGRHVTILLAPRRREAAIFGGRPCFGAPGGRATVTRLSAGSDQRVGQAASIPTPCNVEVQNHS